VRVAVDSIPDHGLTVAVHSDTEWASDAARGALDGPPVALGGELVLVRGGGGVEVTGSLHASVDRACERCGEAVRLDVSNEAVDLVYLPDDGPAVDARGEVRLGADDLDVGFYRGGVLDLADVVSEILALELPSRVACADVAPCDARVQALIAAEGGGANPSPFAALRDLF
jgi:uncharacterized metal-binding protein YceD (DUF177 family)